VTSVLLAVSVLSELLPKPVSVEVREGTIAWHEPVVVRADVEGAPKNVADQAYVLDIAADGQIRITAGGAAGERYARVTLDQLKKLSGQLAPTLTPSTFNLQPSTSRLPCCRIVDWPALRWRGIMNDCGRNYLAVDGVKAFIDVAARYKMNIFHWHLSDYQGWRLESKRYPHLNAPETMMRQVGKFYTQDEFREIVAYARERGVTVMPELDVPGHTYALRRGLGVKTMKDEGVDRMVSELFDELCSLAPADVMPFVHLGTDEVRAAPEYTRPGWCSKWADTVAANGRAAVVWAPGEKLSSTGEVIDMVWHDNDVTNTANRAFDAARMYFAGGKGPELILNQTAFLKPCDWAVDASRKLGAIACCWHDDNVGEDTTRLFANATVLPAILGFANNYWTGSGKPRGTNLWLDRLPPVGTADFRHAQDLERRILAQRDKALGDVPFAFPYLAQTEQHWCLSWADGRVIEPDYVGGLIDVNAFVTNQTGHVVAETWVKVPSNGVYSAWIGCTITGGCYSRQHDEPTPKQGEWSKYGSSVSVNGVKIAPPVWDHPGARADLTKLEPDGKTYKGAVYSNDLSETPLGNDFYYCREPSKVELREGWNHVRLDLTKPTNVWGRCWRGVFRLLEGTTEHPREVKGVLFSSGNEWADRLEVRLLSDEKWWGVATHAGTKLPFHAKSEKFSLDIRKENISNQTAPFMVSDKGRYVWCDAAFRVTGEGGVLTFESEGNAPVRLVTAGTTLREAYLSAAKAHFPPSGKTPDLAFFAKPQWNTWVELTYNQNQKDILAYTRSIAANGFPSGGVLMIDDTWQFGYGVWEFDPRRFADPKAMCDELHAMGFKVMLWVCPYVSMDSPSYRQLAFGLNDLGQPGPKGGLCRAAEDDPVAAKWWNGKSATIDFSDPLGADWFDRQLQRLQRAYGVDGWKFDAGDTGSYRPEWLTKGGVTPSQQSEAYAKIGLRYPLNEYRACFKMAGQPLVQRLCDKDHKWEAVQALIPEMVTAGLMGHSFVCPDMIGSGSWRAFLPDAPNPYDPELFVRSAQVHALSPMMQFSAAPWRLLKGEHLDALRRAVATRMKFADRIVALARSCAVSGEPMLRNLEYAFPGRGYAGVADQFMLGDSLMVAPQVRKGARKRKVILPPGTWRADDGQVHVGPAEVEVETPLCRLPYFERCEP